MREKKSVKCITTGEIFASADEAAKAYDVDRSNIRKCCNGKLKVAGKDSNGQKLKWAFSNGQDETGKNEIGKTNRVITHLKEVKNETGKTKEVKQNGQNESGNYPFQSGKNESNRITELEARIVRLEAERAAMLDKISATKPSDKYSEWDALPTVAEVKQKQALINEKRDIFVACHMIDDTIIPSLNKITDRQAFFDMLRNMPENIMIDYVVRKVVNAKLKKLSNSEYKAIESERFWADQKIYIKYAGNISFDQLDFGADENNEIGKYREDYAYCCWKLGINITEIVSNYYNRADQKMNGLKG